jgi:hypothetical protein
LKDDSTGRKGGRVEEMYV